VKQMRVPYRYLQRSIKIMNFVTVNFVMKTRLHYAAVHHDGIIVRCITLHVGYSASRRLRHRREENLKRSLCTKRGLGWVAGSYVHGRV